MTQVHARYISLHFLARRGGAPECKEVRQYSPYMLQCMYAINRVTDFSNGFGRKEANCWGNKEICGRTDQTRG